MRRLTVLLVPAIILVFGCGSENTNDQSYADWIEEIDTWKAARVESLRTNWVPLVGLHWLNQGVMTFGGSASNDIVFPSRLPDRIGTIAFDGQTITMSVEPKVEVLHDGQLADDIRLIDDGSGDPTTIELDGVEWYAIERDGRYAVRVYDRSLGSRLTLEDLPFYPVDARWNVRATFHPYEPVRTLPVPTVLGTLAEMISPGKIRFEVEGSSYEIDVLEGGPSRYFVMFTDPTNTSDTYEAGRYVYIDHEDENGETWIDFNRSYNPPCAFTPYATCPFAPPQNHIEAAVEAGEKRVDDEPWVTT